MIDSTARRRRSPRRRTLRAHVVCCNFRHSIHAVLRWPPTTGRYMNTSAILTFVVIGGIVWGGLALIITTAFRKESQKKVDQG